MLSRAHFLAALLLQLRSSDRMPNGKSRTRAILQADYEKSKKDIAELIELAQELEAEIEKNQEFVVDVRSLRKIERIEELAGDIKNRMRRY